MAEVTKLLILWREFHGTTQMDISHATGISQSNLSKYENEGRQPTVYTLEKICDYYDITLSQFFEGPDDE